MNQNTSPTSTDSEDSFGAMSNLRELSSQEALELLRAGRPLVRCLVRRLKLTGEFEHEVVIDRCQIEHLQVRGATFRGNVTFRQSKFRRPLIQAGTQFMGATTWSGCKFHRMAIQKATFASVWRIARTSFTGNLMVNEANFQGGIKGFSVHFGGWWECKDSQCGGDIDLRSATAEEGIIMERVQIEGDLNLRGSSINKKLDLTETKVAGTVDLAKTKLHDFVYLQSMQPCESTCYSFSNALAEFIHVTPEQLEGRLVSERKDDHEQAMLDYGLLKRNYSTLHRYEEEDWAFYRFKINQRRSRRLSFLNPLSAFGRLCNYLFLDIGCGYGVQPWRALLFGGIVIMTFGAIFGAGMEHFSQHQVPVVAWDSDGLANRYLFGLLTSISVFTSGFTGDHLGNASGWVLIPLSLEAVIGTVLWGLFVVAFSRKVIR